MRHALLLVALFLSCATAQAEIYKCTLPDGRRSFQQQPCKVGADQEVLPERTGRPVELPSKVEVTAPPTSFSLEETGIFANVLYVDWCSAGVHGFPQRIAQVNVAWRARYPETIAKVERSEEFKTMRAEAMARLQNKDPGALDHLRQVCNDEFISRLQHMGSPPEPERTGRPPPPQGVDTPEQRGP